MTQVHAPYHFVPLSKWVYMPDWAHLVSHDVPFKDGISGVIEYTLTNHTPLCVGDEQIKESGKPSHVSFAKDPNDQPIIPGSSLKGMIRSVLEIASFGKFNQIDDHHFSYRDISNSETAYAKEIGQSRAQAFWLKFDPKLQEWTFTKADHAVIFHEDLNSAYNTNIVDEYFEGNKKIQPTAPEKYTQFPLLNDVNFNITKKEVVGTKGKMVTVEYACDLKLGDTTGSVVFSEFRPGSREFSKNRLNFSYVFYNPQEKAKVRREWQSFVERLFQIHDSKLVDYLKNAPHPRLGIPVFARISPQNKMLALGFAKMPRKLYKLSTQEVAQANQPLSQSQNTFDMAELIFGTLRDKGFGLKSRVQFSEATCQLNTGLTKTRPAILGQPQASFLGGYIEQMGEKVSNELANYENSSRLKGWKRYPKQSNININIPHDLAKKFDIQSTLEVMQPNAQFTGRLTFHNLTKQELGALYWVLNFASNEQKAFHSLGHGKPLGAGAVQFGEIRLVYANANNGGEVTLEDCQQTFIDEMEYAHPEGKWQQSSQIQHLLSFGQDSSRDLSYMPLQSKDKSLITYSSALKGRDKNTLPNWQQLSRQDNLKQNTPSSFVSGRLSELFTDLELSGGNLLSGKEKEFAALARQAEQAAALKSMPEVSKAYYQLVTKFNNPEVSSSKAHRQALNEDVERLIHAAFKESLAPEEARKFFDLAKDKVRCAYLDLANNKKNKEKLKARKVLLKEFAEHYELEHPWN